MRLREYFVALVENTFLFKGWGNPPKEPFRGAVVISETAPSRDSTFGPFPSRSICWNEVIRAESLPMEFPICVLCQHQQTEITVCFKCWAIIIYVYLTKGVHPIISHLMHLVSCDLVGYVASWVKFHPHGSWSLFFQWLGSQKYHKDF